MNSNSIKINEKDLSVVKAKELIAILIDNQIQSFSLIGVSDWERGQATSIEAQNQQIHELKQRKAELLKSLEEIQENDALIDIGFSIDLNFKIPASV